MTENPLVPGPGRDLAMHNDWWAPGWDHVLPRQGFPLTMLIGTASQPGFTGSLDDLLQWSAQTHERVVSAIGQLSEEDLANPNLYPWLNGSPLWEIVDGNGYGHMREHTNDVRAWLEGRPADQETA